jgi:hypothetical protein
MTEKNTVTLILVALIGAVGVIFAACIGLIPTILPMVRPTFTPMVFVPDTLTPSFTPLPDTPSATAAPTDLPTLTPTLQPFETPTETQTTVPTPASSSSNVDDYVGTWVNGDKEPSSDKVKLIVSRLEIEKTAEGTANVSVCRLTVGGDETYVQPHPAPSSIYDFALLARDFLIPAYENLKWTILIQQSGDQVVATVQEYDAVNNFLMNSETFRLQRPSLIDNLAMRPCDPPQPTATP